MSTRRPCRTTAALAVMVLGTLGVVGSPAKPATAHGRDRDRGQGNGEPRVVAIKRRTVVIVRRVESISGDVRTEETPKQVQVTLAADVLFAFDRADLPPETAARIAEVANEIEHRAKGPVAIVGHTDAKGSAAYNADLSLRRATAVRDALAAKAPGHRFTVAGKGATEPVAPNQKGDGSDDPAGRARNRRVTITYARRA